MSQAKKELRAEVIARRDAIDERERERRSAEACAQLVAAIETLGTTRPLVALYSHMGSEVQLDALVRAADERGWRLCFPAMLATSEAEAPMAFFQASATDALERRAFLGSQLKRYTVRELTEEFPLVAPEEIDAMVAPLVAFDSNRMRMGYGGGNYDRYLPQLREDALVVGVGFAEQQVDAVPTEPHDLPLPQIVVA